MHYFIIGVIIITIVYFQVKIFLHSLEKLKRFKTIFHPDPQNMLEVRKINDTNLICHKGDKVKEEIDGLLNRKSAIIKSIENLNSQIKVISNDISLNISFNNDSESTENRENLLLTLKNELKNKEFFLAKKQEELKKVSNSLENLQKYYSIGYIDPANETRETIIRSINSYLLSNKNSVSDFHLIKDIVERNSDIEEDEIATQTPMPLYYGLMGTMAGILVGIGFLVISGGLHNLLTTFDPPLGASPYQILDLKKDYDAVATKGVIELLSGVALAMISSILGILLTSIGSTKIKEAKAEVEKYKHRFLSWMQAELLPKLNTDMADSFEKMTRNLADFNRTFSSNTEKLEKTLSLVNESYQGQAQVLNAINNLKINGVAKANIEVYDKLRNCTDEIGKFYNFLQSTNEYVSNIRVLNEKLDSHETRTKAIEDMGLFFKEERANMQAWSGVVSKSITEVDSGLDNLINKAKDNISKQFDELVKHTIKQREGYEKVIEEQQDALLKKMTEISKVVDEIKNLSAVKTSMANIEKVTLDQNRKIDRLVDSIRELAQTKSSGQSQTKSRISKWVDMATIAGNTTLVAIVIGYLIYQALSFLGII